MTATKLFLSLLATAAVLRAAEWPNYRGPNHDGKSSEKFQSLWPSNGFQPLWKAATPNGYSSFAISGSSVSNGQAVTLVAREVDGVQREVLVAFDIDTGKEKWFVPFGPARYGHDGGNAGAGNNKGGDGPRSTPACDRGRVYVLTSDLVLAAFNAADGKELWRRDLIKEHNGQNITWKNAASPVIDGDLIFVAAGGAGESLLGINKADGKTIWKSESDKITHATPVPATIHGERQIIFFTQKGLVSVKANDGKVLWRHPYRFNVSTAASPVVAEDIVYCSAGYGVGATAVQIKKSGDKYSANELWRVTGDSLANHWSTPIYKDGHLYGMFQFKEYGDGPVKCVDIKTGKVKWSKGGFGPGNVIMVGGELLALTDSGQIVWIEATPTAYKEKGRFQAVSGKCWSTPAFHWGRLYVRSTKEGAAFDLSVKEASN